MYRSRERLEQEINQFAVIERDGMILACAAFIQFRLSLMKHVQQKLLVWQYTQVIVNRTVAAKFCNFSKKGQTTRHSSIVRFNHPYRALVLRARFPSGECG